MDRIEKKVTEPPVAVTLSPRLEALQEFQALLGWYESSEETPDLQAIGLSEVMTTHANLAEHFTYLEGINKLIEEHRALTHVNLNYEPRVIRLSRYLINKDGSYVPLSLIAPFCREGVKLCNLTEAGETAESGVDESNLRVLRLFFQGCTNICRELSALYAQ
jgi:hypothetical protein